MHKLENNPTLYSFNVEYILGSEQYLKFKFFAQTCTTFYMNNNTIITKTITLNQMFSEKLNSFTCFIRISAILTKPVTQFNFTEQIFNHNNSSHNTFQSQIPFPKMNNNTRLLY